MLLTRRLGEADQQIIGCNPVMGEVCYLQHGCAIPTLRRQVAIPQRGKVCYLPLGVLHQEAAFDHRIEQVTR